MGLFQLTRPYYLYAVAYWWSWKTCLASRLRERLEGEKGKRSDVVSPFYSSHLPPRASPTRRLPSLIVGTLRTRTRRSLKAPKPRRARGENAVTSAGKTKLRMRTRRQRQSCANPLNSAKHIFVLYLVLYIINGNIQRGKGSFIVCLSRWKH